jgi:hypothetical protein
VFDLPGLRAPLSARKQLRLAMFAASPGAGPPELAFSGRALTVTPEANAIVGDVRGFAAQLGGARRILTSSSAAQW